MLALILFYFKIEPKTEMDLAKYWVQLEYLAKKDILPIAQVPLSFSNKK